MRVLVACEESQRVCLAFRTLGHEAYSCDLQSCSGGYPQYHIQSDCLPLLNGNCNFYTSDGIYHVFFGKWDLIIAHPPCTYLSNAGARWLYKGGQLNIERYNKGLAAREFFMKFYNADCKRICIENPVPSSIFELPPYSQCIQPYYFGEPYSKKTYLWLKGLPILMATEIIYNFKPYIVSSTYMKNKDKNFKGVAFTSKDRSKTFIGIANAMAAQWGSLSSGSTLNL